MGEKDNELKLDPGAASVYIGVDPEYTNRASHTEQPIVTPAEVQDFIEKGILEVVPADEAVEGANVGVIQGSGEAEVSGGETEDEVRTEPDDSVPSSEDPPATPTVLEF